MKYFEKLGVGPPRVTKDQYWRGYKPKGYNSAGRYIEPEFFKNTKILEEIFPNNSKKLEMANKHGILIVPDIKNPKEIGWEKFVRRHEISHFLRKNKKSSKLYGHSGIARLIEEAAANNAAFKKFYVGPKEIIKVPSIARLPLATIMSITQEVSRFPIRNLSKAALIGGGAYWLHKKNEKTASIGNWWQNRKEDYEYAKMLGKHKYLVYKGGREIGAPTWDLLKHDWSKFKPSVWTPYREAVIGERVFDVGPENIDPAVWKTFRNAVLNHVNSESHHDYKYKNKGEPVLENYADWWAVTKANDPRTPNIKTWLKRKNLLTK